MSTVNRYILPVDLWDHQAVGIQGVIDAIANGYCRLVLTGPCGAGKTRMMTELIFWALSEHMNTVLYTSRKMLFKQTADVLKGFGIEFGERASGKKPALFKSVQLCMTQSEYTAVYKAKRRDLHTARLVLIDEIHMQGGGMMEQIIADHLAAGAVVVAFTATPLDLMGEWDKLIVAGTNSELRKCGAHVPAYTYCPDQPDMKHVKRYKVGEDLSDKDNAKAIMRPGVFGRVWKHWELLNPERKATILFAPDVAGSIHFAEEFYRKGVSAAHIDAKQIWWNGTYYDSDEGTRTAVLDASKSGELTVLCNRFVLREGIDLPHVAHCIMACVFGSLTSYLQSGGRVIRAHPSLESVTVQDHGGNFIRHGSLNANREWTLGQSSYKTTAMRQEAMRERPEAEPIICPDCGAGRLSGSVCHRCGKESFRRSRKVVQIDGSLKSVEGPSFKPHRIKCEKNTGDLWEKMYFRFRRAGRTFNQAAAYFFVENHYWPPKDLPMMPREPGDWFEKIGDVPRERLYQKGDS